MKSEGWRPLRRQRKLLLTAKQRADRLKVATQYKNLTAEEWGYFVPNICFRCPIQKMILFGVLRRAKFLQRIGLKKVQNIIWGGMTGRSLTEIHFLPTNRL